MIDKPNETRNADSRDPLRPIEPAAREVDETVGTDSASLNQTSDWQDTTQEAPTSVDAALRSDETATFSPRDNTFDPTRTGDYIPTDSPDQPATRQYPKFPGYEVLGVLGQGGMGVVYRARQVGLNRLVALKVILAGPQATEIAIVRFRAEAQAVARFQHPSLVQVFEVGESEGLPFFSMEFVDGGNLSKKADGQPQPSRDAAEIVEKLARAMQYTHDRGIAHRDLKPANILLTADGTPKVTDFGLAKSLEGDSGQTQSGQIMGTPSYMAPEQAAGRTDIGAPADIYALGGILYDLLTGRPPFKGSSVMDTLEMVRTREPVPPSELTGSLPRDLETICLKCLQKDIAKRYSTAGDLADDLQRFLEGRPILARPVGRLEKAWRWAKRNPAGATAVLLGLAVLIVPTILSILLFIAEGKASEAKLLAQLEEAKAKQERDEKEMARAAEEVAKMKAVLSSRDKGIAYAEALLALREALIPVDNQMRGRLSLVPIRLQIVNLIVERLDKLRKAVPDVKNPLDARTEAVAHARMGGIYYQSGKILAAREELTKALPGLTATANENPTDVTALVNLASLLNQLADADWRLGQGDKAREKYAAALEVRKKRLPLADALFKDGKASADNVTSAYYQVADSHGLVAVAALRLGNPEAAIESYLASDKAFATLKSAGTLDVRMRRSEIQLRLADARLHLRKPDEAEKHYRAALKERETLLSITPESAGYGAVIRISIGQARMYLGDFLLMARQNIPAATAEYRTALKLFADEFKKLDDSIEYRRLTAAAHYRLGYVASRNTALTWLFTPTDPVDHFTECLRLREPLAKIDSSDTQAKVEWMLALARAGKLAEAEKLAGELASLKELDQQIRFQVVCGYSVLAGASKDAAGAQRCRDRALTVLAELVKDWKAHGQLELDPDLDALRGLPQFAALIHK